MAKLFLVNKKIYKSLVKKEKEEYLQNIKKEIKQKRNYYNILLPEIEDYIENNCKCLKNNNNFKDIQNINLYKEHFEFSESVLIFLEINENYDFKRCPCCGKFVEYVFIHLFNSCENFYMKIYRLNFNNEDIFEFNEDSIINKIINIVIMYK